MKIHADKCADPVDCYELGLRRGIEIIAATYRTHGVWLPSAVVR